LKANRDAYWAFLLSALLLAAGDSRLDAQTQAAAAAQPPDTTGLFDLSLEELLNIPVTSTTKSSLELRQAPGVVRVFTRTEIVRSGFTTLRDVLRQIPGIQVIEYRTGHQTIWVRGVQSRYNNKVLLLIDGVPMHDSFYGHFDIDESLPLDDAERIEIISGPGSVLYGTNAFAGVISITTRSPVPSGEPTLVSGTAEQGSFQSPRGSLQYSGHNLYVRTSYLRTDGFSPVLNGDGRLWAHSQEGRSFSSSLKYAMASWTFIGSYGDDIRPDRYRKFAQDRFWHRRPIVGAVSFNKDFRNRHFKALGYYTHTAILKDEFNFTVTGSPTTHLSEQLNTSLFGADVDYSTVWGAHNTTLGGSFQQDHDEGIQLQSIVPAMSPRLGLRLPEVTRRNRAVFVNDSWSLGKRTLLSAGVRYDAMSHFDNHFSYRAGLTHQADHIYTKLLYGTAFRSPSYREYLDVIAFNDTLAPEHLHTFEAQAGFHRGSGDINLTMYVNDYRDFIKDLLVSSIQSPAGLRVVDDEYAVNADSRKIVGLELQSTFYPRKTLAMRMGSSIIVSGRERVGVLDSGIKLTEAVVPEETDLRNLSRLTVNGSMSYSPVTPLTLSVRALAFSGRRTGPGYQVKVPVGSRSPDNANGAGKIDLSGSIAVTRTLDLTADVSNVLDATIFSPPFLPDSAYDNQWMGRTIRIGLRYRFR
jgi:outer membrane receptor for ferrienterochelin and colicin